MWFSGIWVFLTNSIYVRMSFINVYVLIANVIRHINKKIIEDFTYFFLICDDIIIFLKCYIFLVEASFVGKERLHSEPEIF